MCVQCTHGTSSCHSHLGALRWPKMISESLSKTGQHQPKSGGGAYYWAPAGNGVLGGTQGYRTAKLESTFGTADFTSRSFSQSRIFMAETLISVSKSCDDDRDSIRLRCIGKACHAFAGAQH